MRPALALFAALLLPVPAGAAGQTTGLPPAPTFKHDFKDSVMSPSARPPLPPAVTDFSPPPPPEMATPINVCQNGEAPDCATTVEAALRRHLGGALHLRVYCGTYDGEVVELGGDVWIEGVPCPDGTLPTIAMQGSKRAWLEIRPSGLGPQLAKVRVEKLRLTGPGQRKAPIRLDGRGEFVIADMVIENQWNGVYASGRTEGDIWVLNSRFEMNGHGNAGKHHHIYLSCGQRPCRSFIINNRFGGLYSKGGRNCSNQVRVRAREVYVLGSVFDGRRGCVSRALNTSPQNERVVVRDSVFIQGQSENAQIMMMPLGGGADGEMVVENVVAVSLRQGMTTLIRNNKEGRLWLREVLFYLEGQCFGGDGCVVMNRAKAPGQVVQEDDVRVIRDRAALPPAVRELL